MSDSLNFHKCGVCGFGFYLPRNGRRNCRVCGTWYSSKMDWKGNNTITEIERPKDVKVRE